MNLGGRLVPGWIRRRAGVLRVLVAGALVSALALVIGSVSAFADGQGWGSTVYTLGNGAQNAVLAFRAVPGAGLQPLGSYATGGAGTGSPLGSQGALAVAGGRLLAVNAGSNSVSLFAVLPGGALHLLGTAPSGGTDPISVAANGDLAYVLNAGGDTVSGLRITPFGLLPIAGSTRALSAGTSSPEEIGFSAGGSQVVVTEKGSGTIDELAVGPLGRVGPAHATASAGAGPYGFDLDAAGHLVVSDAAGGPNGTSAVSSYGILPGGLHAIGTVDNGQDAACWLIVDRATGFVYVANAASGTISLYNVDWAGRLTLRSAVTATTGGHPVDEALGLGGSRFFVLVSPGGTIMQASIGASGQLSPISAAATGLPAGSTGLVSISG